MIFQSTSTEHNFPSRNHFQQHQQQQQLQLQQLQLQQQQHESRKSTPIRSKRRFSDDEEVFKKNKPSTPSRDHQQNDYPKFHHPDGGFIQFTPNGTIRTIIKDNTEISEFQPQSENKFNFKNINHGIDGYKLNSFSPTPSVESYMVNGYNNASSATTAFYSYDCDSDLEYDDDDCQMS